ncbi:unnamed protein product [Callosobruchus maculatus]|nr:unnamed protein product [Callosobruchus maculatus]
MLRSNSYTSGFAGGGMGDPLTSQPRGGGRSCAAPDTNGGGMDLGYVTERIIAMWFPAIMSPNQYRHAQRQAALMLANKHGDNYMVFNLSEPKRVLRNEHKHVKEVGWASELAPPLERLCSVCKDIDSWLAGDQHRIAVLHVRGNKDKLGVIVAAYMHYSSICGNAEQALDRFSMRKFLDDNVGPLRLPSNKRYVDYFAGLLSHNIKINAAPMYLTHVTVLGAPSFQDGGCRAFLKIYEGHTPVYTSGVYSVSDGIQQFTVNVTTEGRKGLPLRGDILVKCYHRREEGREPVFACQFHTCAVADHTLSFTRQELDIACNDHRFPMDGAVELHFSPGGEARHPVPAPTPAVPVSPANDDPIVRMDSPLLIEEYEPDGDYDDEECNHTFGPLDGSLYATIAKKPELSPGAVSSSLTVSMDSGISSAGHHQAKPGASLGATTTTATLSSSSPPPASSSAGSSHPSPSAASATTAEDQHRELDELLSDMLLTVQSIPDVQTTATRQYQARYGAQNAAATGAGEDEQGIPYHARQTSQPFSYGVNSNMIGDSKKLSSPSLVRKATVNRSHGDTLQKVQAQVCPNFNSKSNSYNNYGYSKSPYHNNSHSYSSSPAKYDPIDDIFTASALNAKPKKNLSRDEYYREETKRYDPLKRSLTEGTIQRNREKIYKDSVGTYSDSESLSPPGQFRNNTRSPEFHETYTTGNNLTWLQRQQQKLKERREMQLREERQPHETRLLSELKSVQSRHMRPTASHRLDGYTSDTTAFADDDDDYTIPLHINTTPKTGTLGSTSSYSTLKSNYSSTKERPFMSVKRAHDLNSQNRDHQTAAQLLAANPLGHALRTPPDSGLLSTVEDHYKVSGTTNGGLTTVGITSSSEDSPPSSTATDQHLQDSAHRLNALNDLIANLSGSGSDHSSNSPNSTTCAAWQYREEAHTWQSQSFSEVDSGSSPRPQTPAFPVARTPYMNNTPTPTPTVQFDLPSERLPPKSPNTQRRLSFPSSTKNMKWSLSPERKDRPTSPSDFTNGSITEYSHVTHRSVSATPTSGHRDISETYQHSPKSPSYNGPSSPTVYYDTSRRSSLTSGNESPHEVSAANVKFVRDTSKYWYKPTISREQAIQMLRDKSPGTFVVRDSNSFPGAFGLAVRVATVPPTAPNRSGSADDLIRHFLIEPTSRGVRLKGCQGEPVFSSLSALVYQHSITPMALPCRLLLPQEDFVSSDRQGQHSLYTQGAACNVLYLDSVDMESLTGPQAVKKAVLNLFQKSPTTATAVVHFKVNDQGVTLTDNKRKLFFRRHYPITTVSYCGIDPEERRWLVTAEDAGGVKSSNRIFGFVARKSNVSNPDNQCHLFAELEPEQPATAIVNFLNKILSSSGIKPNIV